MTESIHKSVLSLPPGTPAGKPLLLAVLFHVVILGAPPGSGAHHWGALMTGAAAVSPVALEQRHRHVDPDATVLTLDT